MGLVNIKIKIKIKEYYNILLHVAVTVRIIVERERKKWKNYYIMKTK